MSTAVHVRSAVSLPAPHAAGPCTPTASFCTREGSASKRKTYVEVFLHTEQFLPHRGQPAHGEGLSVVPGQRKPRCPAVNALTGQTTYGMSRASRATHSWTENCSKGSTLHLKKSIFFFLIRLQTSIPGLGKWEEIYLCLFLTPI